MNTCWLIKAGTNFPRYLKMLPTFETTNIKIEYHEKYIILGAVAGDVLGSAYEFYPVKDYNFNLFHEEAAFTDDTVLTMAVADWILHDLELSFNTLVDYLQSYGKQYRGREYGDYFYQWLYSKNPIPYNSYGEWFCHEGKPGWFCF